MGAEPFDVYRLSDAATIISIPADRESPPCGPDDRARQSAELVEVPDGEESLADLRSCAEPRTARACI